MGMKVKYEHVERPCGDLGGNIFYINLDLQTDDGNIYGRVVEALSNALGYPKETKEKAPSIGFGMPSQPEPEPDDE